MNGESEQPPESQEPVEGAELCPKCLGLVFREDGVCKHCGERVFPCSNVTLPSAEKNEAFRRKLLILMICNWLFLAARQLYGLVSNTVNGATSSWMDWLNCILYTFLLLWLLSIWQIESQQNDPS